jgi:hypothetical protein
VGFAGRVVGLAGVTTGEVAVEAVVATRGDVVVVGALRRTTIQ